jgi:hypothetical protein
MPFQEKETWRKFMGLASFLKNYVQVFEEIVQNGGFRQLLDGLFTSEISTDDITSVLARNTGTLALHANVNRQKLSKTQLNSVFVWIMQNRCPHGAHKCVIS